MTMQLCQQVTGWAMQVELKDIMALLAFLLAVAGQTWGIIHFMLKRQDEHKKELEDQLRANNLQVTQEVSHLHSRVNEVKDTYVKRTELDREFASLQKYMSDMKTDFHNSINGVGHRIDQVIAMLSRKFNE